MRRSISLRLLLPVLVGCWSMLASAQTSFVAFESGPVRPLALSPDGSTLYATNIPDNTLEIFSVGVGGLTRTGSVQVGMEPVAVAVRDNGGSDEVWVVNHLSDSVSIVDTSGAVPFVRRTLLVGDEPRDIVFAGTGGNRAFITTAHRGQQRSDASLAGVTGAGDPQLTTPGVGRADVWVFDATGLGTAFGGTPVRILSFFADTPRALATDGTTVYVAAFHSGNQTTTINETLVPNGFANSCGGGGVGQGVPGPSTNAPPQSAAAPETGIIVKFDGSDWVDALGCTWNGSVPFDLPDHDVFSINADTLGSLVQYDHVGTILFNMAVNPSNGKVYVTNTELPNHVRFEGPGVFGGSTVQGHLSESRVTVIDPAGPSIDVQHLNQHIDYNQRHTDAGANHALIDAQAAHSLATPLQPVVSSDGSTIYVAAFGSSKIGVFSQSELEDASFEANFDPTVASADYLDTSGGGPAGLALDETHARLYVLTRFNNAVEVIELGSGLTSESHALHNPEPKEVVDGRPFLYDAQISSGNGEASCSSCHIFGDMDDLAWNLGDPDATTSTNTQPSSSVLPPAPTFHPMKGPMTTQTLRGLATHGGMHWRGDRVDGFFGTDPCTEPNGAPCDELHSFRNFIVAFEGLVGKHGTISSFEMTQFANFALELLPPPNPVRNLDNSLTTAQGQGLSIFNGAVSDTVENCNGCHNLDPAQGFFASGGEQSFEGEPQNAKVPHMRNMYAKIGMFFSAGDQIRGFGFLHDGSVDTVKTFVEAGVFSLNNSQELDLQAFAHVFPSDLAPIVGQQMTIGPGNFSNTDVNDRIDLLVQRANTAFTSLQLGGVVTECDVVAKTVEGGVPKGYVRLANGTFLPDDNGAAISEATLRNKANPGGDAQTITYTCAPPGSGTRMGVDRDEDVLLDGVETNTGTFVNANDTGTDPANADTDGDGIPDGLEVANGTNPTDPLDPAPPVVPALPAAGGALLVIGLALGWRDRRSRSS